MQKVLRYTLVFQSIDFFIRFYTFQELFVFLNVYTINNHESLLPIFPLKSLFHENYVLQNSTAQ